MGHEATRIATGLLEESFVNVGATLEAGVQTSVVAVRTAQDDRARVEMIASTAMAPSTVAVPLNRMAPPQSCLSST